MNVQSIIGGKSPVVATITQTATCARRSIS